MKKIILSVMIVTTALFAGCKNGGDTQATQEQADTIAKAPVQISNLSFNPDSVGEEPVFDINTSMGRIRIKLYKDTPLHRDNFVKLASKKYYDGILFHRVIPYFMIQTGDPATKDPRSNPASFGNGGPGYTIPAEILPNHKHNKGAVAAARKGDIANPEKASSGSQFYICVDNANYLDGDYTVFGEVVEGQNIADAISRVPTGAEKKDLPNNPIKIESITLVVESPAED